MKHTHVQEDVLWRQKPQAVITSSASHKNKRANITNQGSCNGTHLLIATNLLQGQPHQCPQAFRMICLRCLGLR